MSRKQITILAMMALLVVCVYGGLLAMAMDEPQGELATVPTSPPEVSCTAMEELSRAEEAARAWQSDVQLIGVSAAWREPTEAQLLSDQPAWSFQFFSPSTSQVYRVTVTEANVDGAPDAVLSDPPALVNPGAWQIDSPSALLLFLSNGGREFLANHHITTVRLRLSAALSPGRVVWLVAALSSTDRTGLSVLVDASTGEVEEAQPVPSQ